MASSPDIRWRQRLSALTKAFGKLRQFSEESLKDGELSELEQHAIIKSFEYTFELAWKTLQDILIERGITDVRGPRPVIRRAFSDGLIKDGEGWLVMLDARNSTTHIYDEAVSKDIAQRIVSQFMLQIEDLLRSLEKIG